MKLVGMKKKKIKTKILKDKQEGRKKKMEQIYIWAFLLILISLLIFMIYQIVNRTNSRPSWSPESEADCSRKRKNMNKCKKFRKLQSIVFPRKISYAQRDIRSETQFWIVDDDKKTSKLSSLDLKQGQLNPILTINVVPPEDIKTSEINGITTVITTNEYLGADEPLYSEPFRFMNDNASQMQQAKIIYCTTDGKIYAFHPLIDPQNAVLVVNTQKPNEPAKRYLGGIVSDNHYFVIDESNDTIDVYDGTWNLTHTQPKSPEGNCVWMQSFKENKQLCVLYHKDPNQNTFVFYRLVQHQLKSEKTLKWSYPIQAEENNRPKPTHFHIDFPNAFVILSNKKILKIDITTDKPKAHTYSLPIIEAKEAVAEQKEQKEETKEEEKQPEDPQKKSCFLIPEDKDSFIVIDSEDKTATLLKAFF